MPRHSQGNGRLRTQHERTVSPRLAVRAGLERPARGSVRDACRRRRAWAPADATKRLVSRFRSPWAASNAPEFLNRDTRSRSTAPATPGKAAGVPDGLHWPRHFAASAVGRPQTAAPGVLARSRGRHSGPHATGVNSEDPKPKQLPSRRERRAGDSKIAGSRRGGGALPQHRRPLRLTRACVFVSDRFRLWSAPRAGKRSATRASRADSVPRDRNVTTNPL